ncbi:hypothetical protein [Actinomadura vinacea]
MAPADLERMRKANDDFERAVAADDTDAALAADDRFHAVAAVACAPAGTVRREPVTLARPLGERVVLNIAEGLPVSVTR